MPRQIHRLLIIVATVAAAASCSTAGTPTGTSAGNTARASGDGVTSGRDRSKLEIEALSTRAEYVTGGDVVVAVYPPAQSAGDALRVSLELNGTDLGPNIWRTDKAGRVVTTVAGLRDGGNEIVATLAGQKASLTVSNHPTTGPLFSGPQLPMPVCSTEAYGLGPATDANCSAPTRVTWRYKSTDGSMKELADPSALPADVANVSDGPNQNKRFIVRTETGVLNRSIYWIDVLDPQPSRSTFDGGGWNGRLVYQFGGGCGTTYTQGFLLLGRAPEELIAAGYATATGTLNTFQVMCNDVLSAETALMVKEHFSEVYGPPVFTIGSGGSGGAIQQYLIAYNYPGILDAVGATMPFPDALSIAPGVVDCVLLNAYYQTEAGAQLSDGQRLAINGHGSTKTCEFWAATFAQNIRPDTGCALDILASAGKFVKGLPQQDSGVGLPKLPPELRYDPVTNRGGLRCTLQDGLVNIVGRNPATGFARRPLDNVGVQYGLSALNSGTITPDQFLDLNERIGGADIDGRATPERMRTTESEIKPVYESGRVIERGGPLDSIPIVTVNVYTDQKGDIHDRVRAFTIRERLAKPDGSNPPNHMVWTRGVPSGQTMVDALTGTVDVGTELITTLDEWLTSMSRDATALDRDQLLERNRPPAAVDNCIGEDGRRISGLDVYEVPGFCRDSFPVHGDPRISAGESRRNDIGKCQLQPARTALENRLITVDFSVAQSTRYAKVFPEGVCDWNKPGVGQVPTKEPWQDYGH